MNKSNVANARRPPPSNGTLETGDLHFNNCQVIHPSMMRRGASAGVRISRRWLGSHRIAAIYGDGIGKEVVTEALRVLRCVGQWDVVDAEAGYELFQRTGDALPQRTKDILATCEGALFGAVGSPSHKVPGYRSPIIQMRTHFDLFANLRPVTSTPVPGSRDKVDMLIVRENTECLYVKQETLSADGEKAVAQRVITRSASNRIAHMAFQHALKRNKGNAPKVTVVHKSNVLSVTDGLFRECCLKVAALYPTVEVEEQLVDSMVYKMILAPEAYDVVVAPNLYGDILSDAGAALVGGLGLVPSMNTGQKFFIAEPVHGSAPDIAGKNLANPIAAIRSGALMCAHLGDNETSQRIELAVQKAIVGGTRTRDLGGSASTKQMTDAIIAHLQ